MIIHEVLHRSLERCYPRNDRRTAFLCYLVHRVRSPAAHASSSSDAPCCNPAAFYIQNCDSDSIIHFEEASELDRRPLGTGSMLILFPRLLTEDGGLVIVRFDSGLDPSSVDLSSSGDSSRPVSLEGTGGKSSSDSAAELSTDCRGGVRMTASRLFMGEFSAWWTGDAAR